MRVGAPPVARQPAESSRARSRLSEACPRCPRISSSRGDVFTPGLGGEVAAPEPDLGEHRRVGRLLRLGRTHHTVDDLHPRLGPLRCRRERRGSPPPRGAVSSVRHSDAAIAKDRHPRRDRRQRASAGPWVLHDPGGTESVASSEAESLWPVPRRISQPGPSGAGVVKRQRTARGSPAVRRWDFGDPSPWDSIAPRGSEPYHRMLLLPTMLPCIARMTSGASFRLLAGAP